MQRRGRQRFLVVGQGFDQAADERRVDVADILEQLGHGPPFVEEHALVAAAGGQRNGRGQVARRRRLLAERFLAQGLQHVDGDQAAGEAVGACPRLQRRQGVERAHRLAARQQDARGEQVLFLAGVVDHGADFVQRPRRAVDVAFAQL